MFKKKILVYKITPHFPAVSIVADKEGLAEGETKVRILYDNRTKTLIINDAWEINLGEINWGDKECIVPLEMGGDGVKSITFRIDSSKLPIDSLEGEITIFKYYEKVCCLEYYFKKLMGDL